MCIFHKLFVCIIYPYTYPYIILRQNSKKRKRKSIFFMHLFVESMKYSHFYRLAFFTKANSVSLLYSEILSLLTFSLSGLSSFCRQSSSLFLKCGIFSISLHNVVNSVKKMSKNFHLSFYQIHLSFLHHLLFLHLTYSFPAIYPRFLLYFCSPPFISLISTV